MAIESQPPVLRRVQPPNELEMVNTLKLIQSNFTQNQMPKHFGNDKILEDVVYKLDSIKTITSDIFDFLSSSIKSTENRVRKLRSDIGGTHKKRLALDAPKSEPEKTTQQKQREEKEESEEESEGRGERDRPSFNLQMPRELESTVNSAIKGMLGPLNLIMDPIMSVLGKDYTDLVKPTDGDVKKKKGGIYWLWKKVFGKKDRKKDDVGGIGGFLGKIFGGMSFAGIGAKILKTLNPMLFSKIAGGLKSLFTFIFKGNLFENIGTLLSKAFPKLIGKKFISVFSKAGPIAMIVGGLAMAVKDGIKGLTQGWKTSKVSNFAGSFLGGADKGIKGAFKNMGKWALIGAGVGSFVPVVGTVLGGVLGAVVGGILGFIGGENIAKAFDAVGSFVNKWIIQPIVTFFKFIGSKVNEYVIQPVAGFFKMIGNFFYEKVITPVTGFFKMIGNFFYEKVIVPVVGFVSPIVKKVADVFIKFGRWFYKFFMLKELGEVLSKVFKKFKGIPNWVKDNVLAPIGNFFKKAVSGLSSGFKWISDKVLAPIGDFFKNAWGKMKEAGSWIKDNILAPVGSFFVGLFESFKDGLSWVKDNILAPVGSFFGDLFTKIAESEVVQFFKEKIINPIKSFFSYIGNLFGFIFSGDLNVKDLIMGITEGGRDKIAEKFENYLDMKSTFDTDSYKEYDSEMSNKDKYWNRKLDAEKYEAYKKSTKVQDAIITPQGRVIIPSSDDTIIATKSPVDKFKKDDVSQDLKLFKNQPIEKNNGVVEAINKLIKTVDKKPFNNVFSNTSVESTNFDRLRTVFT